MGREAASRGGKWRAGWFFFRDAAYGDPDVWETASSARIVTIGRKVAFGSGRAMLYFSFLPELISLPPLPDAMVVALKTVNRRTTKMTPRIILIVAFVLIVSAAGAVRADDAPMPPTLGPMQPSAPAAAPSEQPSAAALAAKLEQLEAETNALRSEVKRLKEQPARLPTVEATPVATPPAPPPAADEYFTLDELRGEMKKLAWTKGDFSIVPYGFLWGNMVYSSQQTVAGSYTLYVRSASTTDEGEFIVDGRNTRLGFDVGGPKIPFFNCAKSGGKVEIDFQNSVLSTENKATVLLRHAYLEVKDEQFRFLAGQTWDVISPLNPGMLMYSVGWDGGNIGYRRAQFRYERYLAFSDCSMLTAQMSANQQPFVDGTKDLTGEPSNWPIMEGRVAWTIGERGKGGLPVVIGLSGHAGEVQFDHATLTKDNRRRTWSANIDFRMPFNERMGFQAELFAGENLGTFLGGIGQGINPTTFEPIRSRGGWGEFWYDWTPRLHSHVGYSLDDPNDVDANFVGGKTYNQFFFGNLIFDLTKQFLIGMEVSSWKTLYARDLPGDSLRCEFVAKYGF
jgi:hypothetical protein